MLLHSYHVLADEAGWSLVPWHAAAPAVTLITDHKL